jgi:hypothetical protein
MTKSRFGVFALGTLFIVAVLAVLIYTSLDYHQFEVEVCITYRGRRACGTAAGANREEALRAATNNACSSIAGGMTENIACSRTEPDIIRWIGE